jgi:hypothetical protein
LLWHALGDRARAEAAWTHSVSLLDALARRSTDHTVIDPWVRALLYLGRREDAAAGHTALAAMGYRVATYWQLWQERGAPTAQP